MNFLSRKFTREIARQERPDGGAAGNRTPIHTKPRIRLYKLSPLRQALRRFGQVHKRHARFELRLFLRKRRKSLRKSTPEMMSECGAGSPQTTGLR